MTRFRRSVAVAHAEELGGRLSDLYRITDRTGRREVWVSQAGKLPLRLKIFNRTARSTRQTDFLNWLSGLAIDDTFFEPEPAIRFDHYELEQYVRKTALQGVQSAVPILYVDLLHGPPGQ